MNWKSILLWGVIVGLVLFFIKHSLPLVIGLLLGIAADRLVLLTATRLDDTALGWLKDWAGKIGK